MKFLFWATLNLVDKHDFAFLVCIAGIICQQASGQIGVDVFVSFNHTQNHMIKTQLPTHFWNV